MGLKDNLVSYYKLDETTGTSTVDSHGTNDGTIVGDILTTGKINNGITTSSTSERVDLADGSNIFGITNKFTFSGWLYIDSILEINWVLGFNNQQSGDASNNKGIGLFISTDGNLVFIYGKGTEANQAVSSTDELTTDSWTHISVTLDDDEIKIYINGEIDSTHSVDSGDILWTYTSEKNQLGNSFLNGTQRAGMNGGKLDEVGIWSRALSSDEITELYNNGNALAYDFDKQDASNGIFFSNNF